jgi:hypothetical protein
MPKGTVSTKSIRKMKREHKPVRIRQKIQSHVFQTLMCSEQSQDMTASAVCLRLNAAALKTHKILNIAKG